VIAPQSATILYIYRVRRSYPCWSRSPNQSHAKIQLQLGLQSPKPGQSVWTTRFNHPCDVHIFQSHVNLDLLDETYPMGKFKLPFKNFGLGGLTGLIGWSNMYCLDLPILGVNICPLFLSKACVLKKNSKAGVTLYTGHFVVREILIEIDCIFQVSSKHILCALETSCNQ
jgi:hypothetical protein